ncbi:Uu.00g021640.m01.CDS01 [Anthostomella pinea]|uniref:Uu.00g021640.m01.CDS01 n=1 Tax=Anthostomella pinea TaxID=933095 RepID=A0AAI8YQX8_9PEZI|nr:Uu.00g021640.m01.CDS01 [Anthostomella pinea]
MTRYIDTVPTPAHVKPKKLIVLSAPRTGTHGLYLALQELGFKPYHMVEAIMDGPSAIRIMEEGMDAEFFHRGKRYGREEFDKWFADYDIIIEMPFFMLHSVVRAYPEAKFLLTERDPEKWAKSFENTIGHSCQRMEQLPMSVFKYFDSFVSNMSSFGRKQLGYCTNGFGLTEEGHRHLVENYED